VVDVHVARLDDLRKQLAASGETHKHR
jgi:hypothetical protein